MTPQEKIEHEAKLKSLRPKIEKVETLKVIAENRYHKLKEDSVVEFTKIINNRISQKLDKYLEQELDLQKFISLSLIEGKSEDEIEQMMFDKLNLFTETFLDLHKLGQFLKLKAFR